MKKILLPLLFSCFCLGLNAQVFELYDENNQLFPMGDTVFFNGDTSALPIVHMKVKNISTSEQIVHCKKAYEYVVPGTINAFCWAGSCYTSMTAPLAATMAAGETNSEFSAEYMPQGIAGISIIRYYFYNETGDSTHFVAKFNIYLTGIENNTAENLFSKPFPVPAKDNICIMASNIAGKNAEIELNDILGNHIKRITIKNEGLVQIPVSELNNGVYFFTIKVNNQIIKSHKVIIAN